jgi:hypothetical protein
MLFLQKYIFFKKAIDFFREKGYNIKVVESNNENLFLIRQYMAA